MKRTKWFSMLMALCMIVGMLMVPGNLSVALAEEEEATIPKAEETYLDHNFDTESTSGLGYSFTPKGGTAEIVYDAEAKSGYLRMVRTLTSSGSTGYASAVWNYYRKDVDTWSEYVVFSADIKSTSIGRLLFGVNGTERTANDKGFVILLQINEGTGQVNLKSTDGNGKTGIETYKPSEEYTNITFVFNCADDTYSFFWNGELKAQDLPIPLNTDYGDFGKLASFKFEVATAAKKSGVETADGEWLIDNIKIYSYNEATYQKVEAAGDVQSDVLAKYIAAETPADVYSVDVSWGAMEFDYYAAAQTWDTENHKWVADETASSGWQVNGSSNTVTLENHSSKAVKATFAFTPDEAYTGLSGGFTYNGTLLESSLELAAPTEGEAEVTKHVVSFMPDGTLADTHSTAGYARIGVITVTIE